MKIEPQTSLEVEDSVLSVAPNKELSGARSSFEAFRVLRSRNYALLFWGQLISAAGTQMQVVAVAWQVYLLTHSAIALGLIGLMQALPRLLFSLVGGVLADVLDRRKMLMIVNLAMMIFSAILALCSSLQMVTSVSIYLLILLSATASSFEFPTRLAIIPHLVPREQMADAISLNSVMVYLIAIIGPTAGGLALAWLGVAPTYWLNVVSYLVVIAALFFMHEIGRAHV